MNRENWKTVKLEDISTQIRGVSYKPADVLDEKTEYSATILRANNINEDKINYDELVFVKQQRVSDEQYLQKGDILICASSGSKHLVGKAACFNDDKKVTFGAFCKVVRPNGVDFEYLKHYFFSPSYRQIISSASEGANINNIRTEDLENLVIPLPPLDVQKQIALNLDQVTKVIAEHKELLAKYDLLIKSRFIEMFGDPVTNPMGWEVKKLCETTEIITGNTPSRKEKDNYGSYIEWIKTDNITNDTYVTTAAEYLSEKGEELGRTVESGSILMACIAGSLKSIGRVALTDRKVAFNQQINAIVPKNYNNLFLYVLFQNTQSYAQSTVNMALKGILSKGKLEQLEYILPPLELQQRFADFVQQIDKSKLVVQQSLEKAETLYKSLMQEYFG